MSVGNDHQKPAKKILLAEDDASMRRYVEIILKKAEYEVLTAEDGLAAMQIALETKLDAVVADAIMPNLSGYDLCRMLRGNAETKEIPLILLSGLDGENADGSEGCVYDAFLTKDENLKNRLATTLKDLI